MEEHNRGIWLPPDNFISKDDFIFMHNHNNLTRTRFDNSFPASSPADSFEFRSAVESVIASMETAQRLDRASLLTELTRRPENAQALAVALRNLEFVRRNVELAGIYPAGASLCRNTHLPPPPCTAAGGFHDPWYEVYAAAAAAAARRRMNGGVVVPPTHRRLPAPASLGGAGYCTCQCLSHNNLPQPPNHIQVVHERQNQAMNQISSSIWARPTREIAGDVGPPEPACHRKIAPAKRETAGTGVFIPAPRSSGNGQPGPSQKKTARPVQTPNRNLESFSTKQAKPSIKNEVSPPDFDEWVAQRNAFQQQQRAAGGGIGRSNEVCLPQEWPY